MYPKYANSRGFTLVELMIVVSIIAIIAAISIPSLITSRMLTNESAAIATLKNLSAAQAQCQAAGIIDGNQNGAGEYGFFGELAGGVGIRFAGTASTDRLSPPVLSGAFANVSTQSGLSGGVVTRSGYLFQLYLPSATAAAVAEKGTGGVGSTAPDPMQSEVLWCCYAWPSSFGNSGKRTFFVHQAGDILNTKNLTQRYSGAIRVPDPTSAYLKDSGNAMGSTVASNTSGNDDQVWNVVQ